MLQLSHGGRRSWNSASMLLEVQRMKERCCLVALDYEEVPD